MLGSIALSSPYLSPEMDKTFRNSPAVPHRAVLWITSILLVKLSFPMYSSNISDTATDVPFTIGTTVTFVSFHNFPISSQWSWYFSVFSSFLSFTCTSPQIACWLSWPPLPKMMSGLLASSILSHCTLKSHRTLKPVFFTTCKCLYHRSAHSSLAFPHSFQCTNRDYSCYHCHYYDYYYYILVKFSCSPSLVAGFKQCTWDVIGEEVTWATVLSFVCGLFQSLWFPGFNWC